MEDDPCCEVCITGPDADWMTELARRLVGDRLCACVHLVHPIRAIYRWQGVIHDEAEVRAALHTRLALVDRVAAVVVANHPYDVPGIFVLPIIGGSPKYLQWVRDETDRGD